MTSPRLVVDERGVGLSGAVGGSYDVYFDDQHIWSFSPPQRPRPGQAVDPLLVPWPRAMRPWLDGAARLRIDLAGATLFDDEVRFGTAQERIAFRDKDGIPVMIDKWGLLQRPFTGRGAGVVTAMVDMTERILEVLERDCGIRAWIAFGTLLGAARSGKVIGYDSDIDLAYVSERATPAEMTREMYAAARALRRAGINVINKSGSFITAMFPVPDGGTGSIDLYTCFYLGDLLHETATVRAAVPREAIEPLTTCVFEGRPLPAPADSDALLTASYGPDWRTPDPSFRHRPSAEITSRFDGWFGSLMRNRRDWERQLRDLQEEADLTPTGFAQWVLDRLPERAHVVDVGTGNGRDALAFAAGGWSVTALDYARNAAKAAAAIAKERDLPVRFDAMNLYDLRDTLTQAAVVARAEGPPVLYARSLLETLEPDAAEAFWRFVSMVLSGGGSAYLECGAPPTREVRAAGAVTAGGRLFLRTAGEVARTVEAAGGRVTELVPAVAGAEGRWRMAVQWVG